MHRLLPTLLVLLWLCPAHAQTPPSVIPSQRGFEAFRYRGEPSAAASDQVSVLLRRLEGCPTRAERLGQPPDVEVQAFRLGSEYPELYSVWLKRGWVLPGSYAQLARLGLVGKPVRVLVVRSQPPR